jgi:hypothetical protein
MPARGAPKPPPGPSPQEVWIDAFITELIRLRPHLNTYKDKVARTIALSEWPSRGQDDPKKAAKAYHEGRK